MRNLINIFILLLMLSFSHAAIADELKDSERNSFFIECNTKCYQKQINSKENAILMSTPFIFEAYCSCYCMRMSARSTREEFNIMLKSVITGRIETIKNLEIYKKSTSVCQSMLID